MFVWKKNKMIVRTGMLTAAFAAMLPFTALADKEETFVSGTKINGLSVSGMTVDEARVCLEDFSSSSYKLTVRARGGKQEVILGSEIGCQIFYPAGLQEILDAQNEEGRLSGPELDHDYRLGITASFDPAALETRIRSLNCVGGSGITVTADAYISGYQEGKPFTVIPEVKGNNLDLAKTTGAVQAAVSQGRSELSLEAEDCYVTVKVTKDDPELLERCKGMNHCREMEITYRFGEAEEILKGSRICTWLTGYQDNMVCVDRILAEAYVLELKEIYDTVGRFRRFQTADGREVEVSGPYGWNLNLAAETDALIAMICTGQTQVREPEYISAAAARDNDWGSTYIEIDLTGQQVYTFVEGELVWEAPCVTGNVSRNDTTPPGIYSITNKETNRVLRGKKLANGSYEYESHVNYWMPFNGGIGLHDAKWRSSFGGTIYQTGGSHGCINLPPSKVPELYHLVYKGMPVICYN